MKSLKIFTFCENCPANHLKAKRNRGYKGSFLAICNCVFFLYLKFVLMNFFYQQALGRAQICLMVQQILGNVINLTQKAPISFVTKHYKMEEDFANIGICVCVGLSNLSPFGNLSHHVFFLFDLFFRHRRPINVAGVVVGNPRFHHIKTVLC